MEVGVDNFLARRFMVKDLKQEISIEAPEAGALYCVVELASGKDLVLEQLAVFTGRKKNNNYEFDFGAGTVVDGDFTGLNDFLTEEQFQNNMRKVTKIEYNRPRLYDNEKKWSTDPKEYALPRPTNKEIKEAPEPNLLPFFWGKNTSTKFRLHHSIAAYNHFVKFAANNYFGSNNGYGWENGLLDSCCHFIGFMEATDKEVTYLETPCTAQQTMDRMMRALQTARAVHSPFVLSTLYGKQLIEETKTWEQRDPVTDIVVDEYGFGPDEVLYLGIDDDERLEADSGVFPDNASYKLSTINLMPGRKSKDQLAKKMRKAIRTKNDMEFALLKHCKKDDTRVVRVQRYKTSPFEDAELWSDRTTLEDRLNWCWVPLEASEAQKQAGQSCRDFIVQMALEHKNRSGLWSVVGTRAHRKCYARSMCNNWKNENKKAEMATFDARVTPDLDRDANGAPTVLTVQNMCVRSKHVPCGLNADGKENDAGYRYHELGDDWHTMYERLPRKPNDEIQEDFWQNAGDQEAMPVEHFARNLRSAAAAVVEEDFFVNVQEIAPEYSLYWPFGLLCKKEQEGGRCYETRADLFIWAKRAGTVADEGVPVLVEYKSRMELSDRVKKIYQLDDRAGDQIQLRLNIWMLYLCTGLMTHTGYIVQASRRLQKEDCPQVDVEEEVEDTSQGEYKDDEVAAPVACVAKLEMRKGDAPWASPEMLYLITRFAIHPYGSNSTTRYVDDHFIVPDMAALIAALGLGIGDQLQIDEDGRHHIFSVILKSSKFNQALEVAGKVERRERVVLERERVCLNLPRMCFVNNYTGNTAKVMPAFVGNFKDTAKNLSNFKANWYNLNTAKAKAVIQKEGSHLLLLSKNWGQNANCNYVPVLFSRENNNLRPLLYCAVKRDPSTQEVMFDLNIDNLGVNLQPANRSMATPMDYMPIFRETALKDLQFEKRVRYASDIPRDDPINDLRVSLDNLVKRKAGEIEQTLYSSLGRLYHRDDQLDRIPPNDFFLMTVNKIYRRHLLVGTAAKPNPVIREFAKFVDTSVPNAAEEPFAAMPKLSLKDSKSRSGYMTPEKLKKLRLAALVRCVHRLVNTRLLRGAMALLGCSQVEHSRVVQSEEDHDEEDEEDDEEEDEQWSLNDIAVWQERELKEAQRYLAIDGALEQEHQNEEWWTAAEDDEYSRSQCFPHISQRAMWSKEALVAVTTATKMLVGGENQELSIVQMIQDHITIDMREACERYFDNQ